MPNPIPIPPLKTHELRIELSEDDRPDDKFSHHVNNARYFAFINQTFRGWYIKMGLRGGQPDFSAVMAHVSYDFLRQVMVPGAVLCRIEVSKVGRSSIEHAVEIWDLKEPATLAGRGRVIHVGIEKSSGVSKPWPRELLAKCWDTNQEKP